MTAVKFVRLVTGDTTCAPCQALPVLTVSSRFIAMALERLEGIVERITFYNAENGYTVLRMRPNRMRRGQVGKDGLATVVGALPELQPGESVRFSGAWTSHSDYGSQFRAEAVEQMA